MRIRDRMANGVRVIAAEGDDRKLRVVEVYADSNDEENPCEEAACDHRSPDECSPHRYEWGYIGGWSAMDGQYSLTTEQASAYFNLVVAGPASLDVQRDKILSYFEDRVSRLPQ